MIKLCSYKTTEKHVYLTLRMTKEEWSYLSTTFNYINTFNIMPYGPNAIMRKLAHILSVIKHE